MYQVVKDLKEEQYLKFTKEKKDKGKNNLYLGVALNKKLVGCCLIKTMVDQGGIFIDIPNGIYFKDDALTPEFISFFKKHLINLAKELNAYKISIVSSNASMMRSIGFKKKKIIEKHYSSIDEEKKKLNNLNSKKLPKFLSIKKITKKSERKKLDELKHIYSYGKLNEDKEYYVLSIDLDTYMETNKDSYISKLQREIGNEIFLESCAIVTEEANIQVSELERYDEIPNLDVSNFFMRELLTNFHKDSYKNINFPTSKKRNNIEDTNPYQTYEYFLYPIKNMLKKRSS